MAGSAHAARPKRFYDWMKGPCAQCLKKRESAPKRRGIGYKVIQTDGRWDDFIELTAHHNRTHSQWAPWAEISPACERIRTGTKYL